MTTAREAGRAPAEAILRDLKERGLIEQFTNEDGLRELLDAGPQSIYVGVDPTASSIHIGHLLPILTLARLQQAGHRPIILVGGATGMIGDPSGRSTERNLLTDDVVAHNVACIRDQVSRFVSFEGDNAALMTNNNDWIAPISYIDWLREVGKHFTINYMIGKESVRRRLEDRDQGISYTEFSYMLLQAYDFWELCRTHGCRVQAGGSDQWGNITAGIELIRRKGGPESFGLTFPLMTTASGEKFGKSAGNAVWLDPELTSPYEFYQYWIRSDDRDVAKYLKSFTFIPLDDIAGLLAEHEQAPHERRAQRRLAEEMTRLVHGEDGLRRAVTASEVLFGSEITGLDDRELLAIFRDVPAYELGRDRLEAGVAIVELLVDSGAAKSRGDARRGLEQGGVYLNNTRVEDVNRVVTPADLASASVLVLRRGRKDYRLVRLV